MVSRSMELERKTLLVQFIAYKPLPFYATSDGTDLVQDILRSQLARSDADILGQEGSVTVGENGEFLTFEPTDTKNRTLHLPIEHLAYTGALRRMRRDPSDQRNPDQILRRDFENVDLANRYAHLIIGPPIFVAVFHGFDNALCYTFLTQSSDDSCLLVMKLMRAFRQHEQQQIEQQGQTNQGFPSLPTINDVGSPSPVVITHESPLLQSSQPLCADNRQILMCSTLPPISNMYTQEHHQDDLIQRLLSNPSFQLVNQPYSSSGSFINRHVDNFPILSAPPSTVCYSSMNPSTTFVTQQNSPVVFNNSTNMDSGAQFYDRSVSQFMRPPSPPIINNAALGLSHSLSLGNTLPPEIVYKQNDQQVTYKQNVIIRWLKPPTPPPQAPIIIREIQAPPEVQPPIICRQVPPCPPTPPPIIVREPPPPCPIPRGPLVFEKRIPPVCLPRQVIVQRCPAPPPKPQAIIYEKYLPPPPQPCRQVIVQRETCQPSICAVPQQRAPCRRLVREIVRQVPQPCPPPAQPALVCTPQQQQQIIPPQQQVVQQMVPVYATRRHIVQPKGVRVIRQVIGPAQQSGIGQVGMQQFQQQPQQIYPSSGFPFMQALPASC